MANGIVLPFKNLHSISKFWKNKKVFLNFNLCWYLDFLSIVSLVSKALSILLKQWNMAWCGQGMFLESWSKGPFALNLIFTKSNFHWVNSPKIHWTLKIILLNSFDIDDWYFDVILKGVILPMCFYRKILILLFTHMNFFWKLTIHPKSLMSQMYHIV